MRMTGAENNEGEPKFVENFSQIPWILSVELRPEHKTQGMWHMLRQLLSSLRHHQQYPISNKYCETLPIKLEEGIDIVNSGCQNQKSA